MSQPFQPNQFAREQIVRYAHHEAERLESSTTNGDLDEVSADRAKELARAFRTVAREVNASYSEGRF